MYKPRPIDTSNIELPDDIVQLTEQLAENNHDLWTQQRIAEGWAHGPERDDTNKKHPDLVPYSDLPESEKEYDRRAAMETLKAILALGYRIELPPKSPLPFPHEEVERMIQRPQDPAPLDLTVLHARARRCRVIVKLSRDNSSCLPLPCIKRSGQKRTPGFRASQKA